MSSTRYEIGNLSVKERRKSSDSTGNNKLEFLFGFYSTDKEILSSLNKFGDSKVFFVDKIYKVNKRNKLQHRILIVAGAAVYIFEPNTKKLKVCLYIYKVK